MTKSKAPKAATKNPGALAKTGKKAGVELTEGQLGQAAGGFLKLKIT
jgi:hypothetical protein